MSQWNFYDTVNPNQESASAFRDLIEYDYNINFKVFQILEVAFRALMSSGVIEEVKTKAIKRYAFGGYSYDTFPGLKGSRETLDAAMRRTTDPKEFVSDVNDLVNQHFSKHKQELGLTKIGIVKLSNLNIAMSDYENFVKSLDLNKFKSGKAIFDDFTKRTIIDAYQQGIAEGLEIADRSVEDLIKFTENGMEFQLQYFGYFTDYLLTGHHFWRYALSKVFKNRKERLPVTSLLVEKIKYEHMGNVSENLRLNEEFFNEHFNAGLVRTRIDNSLRSKNNKRQEFVLESPLGAKMIDGVFDLFDNHNEEFNRLTKRLRFGKYV
ncbi:MAG: hypothetical protein KF802_02200 [Bdellovibrionaceae bacterium]|nr:hypothetical protein [Pseudobdellovibrionaceae bacterium]